ncbi:MAG TPA: hypothetical protein VGG60_16595 [Candidatus Binataceae bacterium]|jgi:hypothetical protein
MRRLFSKSDLQTLALTLTLVVLWTSIPLTTGVVIVSGQSEPELTMNVCQPLQAFDRVVNTLLARPATNEPEFILTDMGSVVPQHPSRLLDHRKAPDTPPPKIV